MPSFCIPLHNESFVSERQKGLFECDFCGTQVTRSFDLTRHKSKCKLAPAITSTSQTMTTFTFLELKSTTSSSAVEESATLVDQSAVLETRFSWREKWRLRRNTYGYYWGGWRSRDSWKIRKNTTEDNRSRSRGTAAVASYSINFSSLPPNGVKVGSVEFQQPHCLSRMILMCWMWAILDPSFATRALQNLLLYASVPTNFLVSQLLLLKAWPRFVV